MFARTTVCSSLLFVHSIGVHAAVACDVIDPDGLVKICDVPSGREATIDQAFSGQLPILFNEGAFLTVFNAGIIDVVGGTALELAGNGVSYRDDGAFLRSDGSTGLHVSSYGDVDLGISEFIKGAVAIDVSTTSSPQSPVPDSDIRLQGAEIVGTATGLMIGQGALSTATILIDENSSITASDAASATAIFVSGGTTRITLAGAILGQSQASMLAEGDDTLELHPGFTLEGQIDGGAGTNTLIFGGAGTGSFDLAAIGRVIEPNDPVEPAYYHFSRFSKTGSSSWTLTGRATERFDLDIASGAVNFDDGRLAAGGTFKLGSDATLSGYGHLDDLEAWGTVAPTGTLYANDVIFHPNSILEVRTTSSGADQLRVNSAVLGGATVRVIPSAGSLATHHILVSDTPLDADDHFNDVTVATTTPRYAAELRYDTNRVTLNLQQTGVTFSSFARTPQQAAVAALLDALGPQAPYYAQLDVMSPEDAADLLEQMSGSDLVATTGALLQNTSSLSTASLGRIQQQAGALGPSGGPMGYAEFSGEQWTDGLYPSVWAKLITGTSTIGGSATGSAALLGGADVQLGDDLTLGLLAGMGNSSIVSGSTITNSTDLSAGLYGAQEFGDLAIRFGASLTHHSVGSTRTVTAPGVSETLTASYGALSAQLFAEVAQRFELGPVGVELFGDVGYARHFSPGFTEVGGAGALTVAASSSDAVDTTIGLRATHKVALGTRLLTTGIMAGWKHRFSATPSSVNSLAGGAPFEVPGISTAGSALVAGANLRFDLDEKSGLDLAYNLEWSGSGVAHAISARYASRF